MADQGKGKNVKRGRPPKKTTKPKLDNMIPAMAAEDVVFALDIGTRTIIGIAAERMTGGGFRVLAMERMEHPGRAMIDGQVEDIAEVGRLIVEVKTRLEQRLSLPLKKVAIAAAGRMLSTVRVFAERELPGPHALADRDMVVGLEGEAIELAQAKAREGGSGDYYCVGYSIVEYRMDGQPVSQLVGHTCSAISVELIAAFLPYSVVEGLYAAVDMSGLEVFSLTLEPIAAINVLIPRELRLLNLALVDVGAGTSDIAICRDGQVSAYDMTTIAGDELTEAIIRKYLVDFQTAERIKLSHGSPTVEYENILGFPGVIGKEELEAVLAAPVEALARQAADKIMAANGGPPAAVFLIGGGSQAPGLGKALSEALQIPEANIAVGPRRNLKGVEIGPFAALTGPEFVTPLGIAMTAITQECFHFFGVSINERRIKLLNTTEVRMMDVLLMAGYKAGQIIARSGRSLLFTVNGAPRVIRGGLPEHAHISLNGVSASVDSLVRPGDVICIIPARDGAPASATLGSLAKVGEGAVCLINGRAAKPEQPIASGDVVEIRPQPAFDPEKEPAFVPEKPPVTAQLIETQIITQAQAASPRFLSVTLNGAALLLPISEETPEYYMMNLLERANVDPTHPRGKLVMQCDGIPVGFMHPIKEHANVEIRWEAQAR